MSDLDKYNKVRRSNVSNLLVNNIDTFIPTPTENDYKRGWISRYFAQKVSDTSAPIYEVNSNEFFRLTSKSIMAAVVIRWRISGPIQTQYDSFGNITDKGVKESNRISIQMVTDILPNLKLYLPNLLQFHK